MDTRPFLSEWVGPGYEATADSVSDPCEVRNDFFDLFFCCEEAGLAASRYKKNPYCILNKFEGFITMLYPTVWAVQKCHLHCKKYVVVLTT